MASPVRYSKRDSVGLKVELLPIGVFQYLFGELVVAELRPLWQLVTTFNNFSGLDKSTLRIFNSTYEILLN